jgi:hypothetical protein
MDLRNRSAEQRQRDNARILADIAQRKHNRELAKQAMPVSSTTASSATTSPSATSLTPTINSLILKGITNFSGAEDQNVIEWLADLRDHFNAARLSIEDARALVTQYLTGDAKKWYQAERDNLAELPWTDFKEALIKAFVQPEHEMKKLAKLLNRRQGPSESVQSYYFDIITLCRQYNDSMSDKDKIAHLINGLRSSLKTAVAMAEPESIQDFLHKAKTGEAAFSLDVLDTHTSTSTSNTSETTAAIQRGRANRQQHEPMPSSNRYTQHVTPTHQRVSSRYPVTNPTYRFTSFSRVPQSHYPGTRQTHPGNNSSQFLMPAAYPRGTSMAMPPQHIRHQWSNPRHNFQYATPTSYNRSVNSSTGCFTCGQPDHRQRNCPLNY